MILGIIGLIIAAPSLDDRRNGIMDRFTIPKVVDGKIVDCQVLINEEMVSHMFILVGVIDFPKTVVHGGRIL